jgi:hypothetical protein
MVKHMVSCWSCGYSWEFSPPLGRGDLCSGCRRDAKVCLNCKFHDRNASRECVESQAEIVKDKDKSNFCEWFESRFNSEASVAHHAANPLDQLFGGSSEPKSKSKLEEEMDAFFKKK